MKYHFIDEPIAYTGEQLSNHWIYRRCGILGDAVVGFIGPCEVDLSQMVDLEDVFHNDSIYSRLMLHFIVEIFGLPLREGVLLQRLFVSTLYGKILDLVPDARIKRFGDDLFVAENKKLSVSICTVSPTSILIHTGLNIESEGTPVEAAGLTSELQIEAIKPFALSAMKSLAEEWEDIKLACCKVKAVS